MDKYQQIASQASIAVIVAGLPAFNRFELLPIDNPSEDGTVTAARHGLEFLGVVALDREGQPRSAFAVDLTYEQADLVSEMFLNLVYRVAGHVEQQQSQARLAN